MPKAFAPFGCRRRPWLSWAASCSPPPRLLGAVLLFVGAQAAFVTAQEREYTWHLRDTSGKTVRQLKTTYDSAGTERWSWEVDYIYAGGRLLASSGDGSSPEFGRVAYHLDHLGTPRVLTGPGGQLLTRHTYHPFGEEIFQGMSDQIPVKFTGHERILDDLDDMKARFYRPSLGRFLSPDPAGQGWNAYAYAGNEPISRVDPDGRRWRTSAELTQVAQDWLRDQGDRFVDGQAEISVADALLAAALIETPLDLIAEGLDFLKLGAGTGDAIDAFAHGEVKRGAAGLARDGLRGVSVFNIATAGSLTGAARETLKEVLPIPDFHSNADEIGELTERMRALSVQDKIEYLKANGVQPLYLRATSRSGNSFLIGVAEGDRFGLVSLSLKKGQAAEWLELEELERAIRTLQGRQRDRQMGEALLQWLEAHDEWVVKRNER